jgi:hypothetical protein
MTLPWNAPLADRFWAKVLTGDGCWTWIGGRGKCGYGLILKDNHRLYAHRVSWELHYGPIPERMLICHRCDNPACVRPDHLFQGTQADNMHDCSLKQRISAKLTWAQVEEIRRLYAARQMTQVALAHKFGLKSHRTVGMMVNGQTWRYAVDVVLPRREPVA